MATPSVNMPSIKTTMKQFFDRDAVMSRIPAAERKAMSQGGLYVMKTARNLIKGTASKIAKIQSSEKFTIEQKQKKLANIAKPSPPGSPPKSRTGLLKDFLFFAYDPTTGHVVVGPAKLSGTRSSPTVPQLLEEGGDFSGFDLEPTGEWMTDEEGEHRQFFKRKPVTKHMPARPYMSAAMAKPTVKTKLAKIWADSIKA